MREFLDEIVIPVIVVAALLFAAIFTIFLFVASFSKVECSNLAEVTKRHTDFRWFGGCYVEHEGEMLPYERWKLLDVRVTNRK